MYVNIDGLKDVKIPINKVKNHLQNATVYCSFCDIPQDFKYAQKLKNIKNEIMSIEGNIERIGFLLDKKIVEFENVEKRNVSLISKLKNEV